MRLILGSQSPRRREILGYFPYPFEQVSPPFDEEKVSYKGNPEAYVEEITYGKARSLSNVYPEDAILTADTVVIYQGEVYGKAKSQEEAHAALKQMQGNWNTVLTGVVLKTSEQEYYLSETTRVLLCPLSDDEIRRYHSQIDWENRAGSYGCQCGEGIIIRAIDGCIYNVMGLPIHAVHELLGRVQLSLWEEKP